jgi:hypothetical protein
MDSSSRRITDNSDVEILNVKAAVVAEFRVGNLTQVPGIILRLRRGETHKTPRIAGVRVATIGNIGDLVVKDNTVNQGITIGVEQAYLITVAA